MFSNPNLARDRITVIGSSPRKATSRALPAGVAALVRPLGAVVAAAGLVLGMGATASAAPEASSAGTHTVRTGDTLSGIAAQYGVSLAAVFELNGLGWNSVIYPGDAVEISAGAAPETGSGVPQTGSESGPDAGSSAGTHTVRSGDTLGGISAQYGVPLESVFELNGLGWNSIIHPGDAIALPAGTAPDAAPQPSQADFASPGPDETPPAGAYNINRGPNYTHRVVLTFDDCPSSLNHFTDVMTWAKNSNIGLVIAPTGSCLSHFQSAYGVDIAAIARSNGQYVINHSVSHADLTTLDCGGVAAQLGAPGVVTNFGRPPYGAMNSAVHCGYAQAGMSPWMWDVDTMDWAGKSHSQIVAHAVQYAYPGSTVLMHLQSTAFSPAAISEIQSGLAARGLGVCRAYGGFSPVDLPSSLPC